MRVHIIVAEALEILVPILVAGAVITAALLLPFTLVLAPLLLVLRISLAVLVVWPEEARQNKVDAVSVLARFLCEKKGECI